MGSMIETERLTLRPLRMIDAPRIARFCNDPAVGRNLARTPLPYFTVAAEAWIMTLAARERLSQDFVYAVDLAGEGLIGAIGAHQSGQSRFEVGYWIGRPFWGQGFATETLTGFLTVARRLGGLEAGHFVDNPASGRVLKKGGFVYTGEATPMFSIGRAASVVCLRMAYPHAGLRHAA